MGNDQQTMWLFRSLNTISSGYEPLSLSNVRAAHLPGIDHEIAFAKTWRTLVDPVETEFGLSFSVYRPF